MLKFLVDEELNLFRYIARFGLVNRLVCRVWRAAFTMIFEWSTV